MGDPPPVTEINMSASHVGVGGGLKTVCPMSGSCDSMCSAPKREGGKVAHKNSESQP